MSALGVRAGIVAAGLRIPEDVSLMAFNDHPIAEHLAPPLTTVRMPNLTMGREAVSMLLAALEGRAVEDRMVEEAPELVLRASTAAPRAARAAWPRDGQRMSARLELSALEQVAAGIDHAEGICVAPDGRVYLSGEKGQIYRLEADDSAVEVATTGGWTLGLAADAEGRIYACDAVRKAVLRWTPGSDDMLVWSEGAPAAPFRTPNWGAFAPDGSYYVSDSGAWKARDGNIQVVRGGRTSVWTAESADFPNGLAITPDGREVWVLESTPGRLVAFDIRPDGSAGSRRVLAELHGSVPDGIAFATDGSIVIACYRPDVVYRWRADLGLEVLAEDPEGTVLAAPTNCAFVGPGPRDDRRAQHRALARDPLPGPGSRRRAALPSQRRPARRGGERREQAG